MNTTVFTLFSPLSLFPPTGPMSKSTHNLVFNYDCFNISLSPFFSPSLSLSPLSSFNVVFRAGHWRIHNLSSILTGENRFSLSGPWLPGSLHQGAGSCEIAPRLYWYINWCICYANLIRTTILLRFLEYSLPIMSRTQRVSLSSGSCNCSSVMFPES